MRTLMCLITVAAAFTAGAGAATQRHAALTVSDTQPLAVKGTGFVRHERLHVTAVTQGRTYTRVVLASSSGTFSAAFAGAPAYDPCTGPLLVSARGPQDHVTLKVPPRECPPPG